MLEFQTHLTPHKPDLQHRTTPGRSLDPYRHRLGTVLRMALDQILAALANYDGVPTVLRLHFQHLAVG